MKKRISLLLALVFACASCSWSLAEAEDRFGKYDDVVELNYLSVDTGSTITEYDAKDPTRMSPTQNAWIDGYLEYLNIRLNRLIAEDETALNARINTSMASGDLPDIMLVSKSTFYVLAENGVLQDLSAVYEEHRNKDYLAQIENSYPDLTEVGKYEGEMLAYPRIGNCYNGSDVLWIRQDWLDQVALPAPTTLDELVMVAKAFQDAKLGGDKTIGISMYDLGKSILAAYGAVLDTWTQQEDGTYVYANTLDGVKDGLLRLQQIYKEGLIKNDFAITDTVDEEIANGLSGILYGAVWRGVTCVQTNLNNDSNATWIPVRIPTLDGEPAKQWTNSTAGTFLCVSSECENPEALFKLIEFENAMRFSDNVEESLRFNVCEDGYQMWNLGAFRDVIRADTDLWKGELIAEGLRNNTPLAEMNPIAASNYELCLNAANGDRSVLGRLVAFVDGYGVTIPLLAEGYLVGGYNGPTTETMTLYQATINEALRNAMIKVIMGEDISVYEKAVEQWYATGGQDITDEVNAYFASNQ